MAGKEKRYDVVVVGGGPAGSAFAYFLGKTAKGLSVALLEAKPWSLAWSKPCGNAIGYHHFEQRGIEPPSGEELLQPVEAVRVYSPSERAWVDVEGRGAIVDRTKLGQRLLKEAADRGAELYFETFALAPVIESGKVAGVVAKRGEEKLVLKCNVLVDASGVSSVIRRRLPSEWPVSEPLAKEDYCNAYREVLVLKDEPEDPEVARIYLNQEVATGGYWWLFPSGGTRVNVGLGVRGDVLGATPAARLREFVLGRPEFAGRVEAVVSAGGAPVPTRRPLLSLAWNGFLAIGDAAFTANPLHGGGIGYAFESALWAARAAAEAHESGDFSASGLWGSNEYMRGAGAKQAALDFVRLFLQKLSNEELNFILEKRLVTSDDVDALSRYAELTEPVLARASKLSSAISRILAALGRPSLLLRLRRLAEACKRAYELYRSYPSSPSGLRAWEGELKALVDEFRKSVLQP